MEAIVHKQLLHDRILIFLVERNLDKSRTFLNFDDRGELQGVNFKSPLAVNLLEDVKPTMNMSVAAFDDMMNSISNQCDHKSSSDKDNEISKQFGIIEEKDKRITFLEGLVRRMTDNVRDDGAL